MKAELVDWAESKNMQDGVSIEVCFLPSGFISVKAHAQNGSTISYVKSSDLDNEKFKEIKENIKNTGVK